MTMVNDINGKAIDFEAAMALAEEDRAVQKGRVFGYHRFCPQFDGQEVEQ